MSESESDSETTPVLWHRFVKGLWEKHEMKPEDLNGWYLVNKMPQYASTIYECICYKQIERRYWITNGTIGLVVGSKCKKQFCPETCQAYSCEICHASHKNRKDNLCNTCRKEICKHCHRNIYIHDNDGSCGLYLNKKCLKTHILQKGRCVKCAAHCPNKYKCLPCSGYKYICLDCGKYANWEFCDDCIVAMGFFDP